MKIKDKLILGLGSLFLLILLIIGLSVFYVNRLSDDTKNILVANYNSLAYSREMLLTLDENILSPDVSQRFEQSLRKQEANVTEIGEREATQKLRIDYENIRNNSKDTSLYITIRKDLADVMMLNMEAIQRKSDIANKTSGDANTWLMAIGTLCFIIALTLLFNLPGNIANPIKELTLSIKSIAAKNYSERVNYDTKDEFGEMAVAFNSMAEKLQEYNNSNVAKLMTEKKRIETLINNIHEPVIGLDENKRILFINDEALNITNTSSEQIIGKPAQDVAMGNDLIRMLIKELFEPVADKGPLKIFADNKESYFQKEIIPINIIPTGEKVEQHIGDVIFLKNITPYKELDFAKTNFLATVSHELKTPISSIKMSTQLLENEKIGALNTEQSSLVSNIKEDAARLLRITSELLNMTQLESGKIQLQIAGAQPENILNRAIENNAAAANEKHIQLQLDIPENLPMIHVDADKTAWILSNLLSNAIRYSYEYSTIIASISLNAQHSTLNFSVKDNGQGIAPQHLPHIFERYYRVPGSKKEGTGLGLSISKDLIEAQKGTITVKSDYGAGSEFVVTLPVT